MLSIEGSVNWLKNLSHNTKHSKDWVHEKEAMTSKINAMQMTKFS